MHHLVNERMIDTPEVYPFEEQFRPVTVQCQEPLQFLDAINIYNKRYEEGEWIFRGQNNATWTLIPSIFRDDFVLKAGEKALADNSSLHGNRAPYDELKTSQAAYEFILARVCAAIEHLRVYNFAGALDNADIAPPAHSDFFRSDQEAKIEDHYGKHIETRTASHSVLRRYDLRREIHSVVVGYSKIPENQHFTRQSSAPGLYPWIEKRYWDISYALAQHSGIPTGLLDWTTDPLVAAFYAAHLPRKSMPDYENIVVWAVDLTPIKFLQNLAFVRQPASSITNIKTQRGLFTRDTSDWLHVARFKSAIPFETYLMNREPEEEQSTVWRITLPFDKRLDLLRLLRKSNISLSTLEPTHHHVADEVRQDFFDEFSTDSKQVQDT